MTRSGGTSVAGKAWNPSASSTDAVPKSLNVVSPPTTTRSTVTATSVRHRRPVSALAYSAIPCLHQPVGFAYWRLTASKQPQPFADPAQDRESVPTVAVPARS